MNLRHSILSLATGALMTACGGGGSGSATPADASAQPTPAAASDRLVGHLVDSPVAGVAYRTESQSGTTDEAGRFYYRLGETVVFSIGSVQFPATPANATVTALDMVRAVDPNHPAVTNILVLLQSLDSDGNPANGITIAGTAAAAAIAPVNFDAAPGDFAADAAVASLLGRLGRAPVSAEAARTHFRATLNGGGTVPRINVAPFARAGAAQSVHTGTPVHLDGASSLDANGDTLTYRWTWTARPAGSTAALDSATAANPSFVPDRPGLYTASLVVSDGQLASTPASVTVTASILNIPPVAHAGPGQNVSTGSRVTLDGAASSDANGDAIQYAWTLASRPAGSTASLVAADTVNPSFVPDVAGTYVLSLTTRDGEFTSIAPSTVTVTAARANVAPVARAGLAQAVTLALDGPVTLDGAASSDANGDPIGYAWTFVSRPAGSQAGLVRATTVQPGFTPDRPGSYVIGLTVNDGRLDSAVDTVTVNVSERNAPPVAHAGPAQSVATGARVTLDGSASSDANGDLLNYAWTLTSKPAGSTAALVGAATVDPRFVPDVGGTYVFSLTVGDGQSISHPPATVTVTATPANVAPVAHAGPAQSVTTGSAVTLNGAASSDADGEALTYAWTVVSRPTGSAAVLTGPTTVNPRFTADVAGSYVFSLVVADGRSDSAAAATVTVSAHAPNAPPVAHAGIARAVATGAAVTLSGAASSDANGDALTYAWTVVSRPAGSAAVLSGAQTADPAFTADVAGSYVFSLVVDDGRDRSVNAAHVTITAASYPSLSLAASATIASGGAIGQGVNDRPVPHHTGVTYAGAAQTFGPFVVTGLPAATGVSASGTLAAYSSVQVNGAVAAATATVRNGDLLTVRFDLAAYAADLGPLGYGQRLQPRLRVGSAVTITFGDASGGGILLCSDPTLPPNVGNATCR